MHFFLQLSHYIYEAAYCAFLAVQELWRSRNHHLTAIAEATVQGVVSERLRSLTEVKLFYEYSVGGNYFSGCTTRYCRKADVAALCERYPARTTVPVSYDPENPSSSYLASGIPLAASLAIAAGLLALVALPFALGFIRPVLFK